MPVGTDDFSLAGMPPQVWEDVFHADFRPFSVPQD
jgi:hypothetical protein